MIFYTRIAIIKSKDSHIFIICIERKN